MRNTIFFKGAWALTDQGIISITNFSTSILIARGLGVKNYGIYVLAYSLIQFFSGIQTSLIVQPMNILGTSKSTNEWETYYNSTLVLQIILALLCGLLFIFGSFFYIPFQELAYLTAFAIVCNQIQEFIRRTLYLSGNIKLAVLNDAVCYIGQIIMILILFLFDSITLSNAIFVVGFSSLLAVLIAVITKTITISLNFNFNVVKENWSVSKWLLGSTLTYWLANQTYPFLTAGLVGVAETGALRAVQNIIGFTHPLLTSIETYFTPIAARKYNNSDIKDFNHFILRIFKYTAIPFYVLLCVLGFFAKPIIKAVYGEAYAAFWPILSITCFLYAILFLNRIISIALNSMRLTQSTFVSNSITAILTLTFGIWLIKLYGVYGSVLSSVINAVLTLGMLWAIFYKRNKINIKEGL